VTILAYDGERAVPAAMSPHDPVLREHLERYRWATEQLRRRLPPDAHLALDVPCGAGYGTRMLAGAAPDLLVHGIDIDPRTVAYARETYDHPRVAFHEADMELPLYVGPYDAVVCFEGIEHVEDQPRVAQNLVDALAPGGLLIVSTPRRGGPGAGSAWHTHEFALDEFVALFASRLAGVQVFGQERRVDDCPAHSARYFVLTGRRPNDG
jgi:2-polyprenyl-3-methyl-5-hydroxy-6-metoxy-1,4-benzoquinol methylase